MLILVSSPPSLQIVGLRTGAFSVTLKEEHYLEQPVRVELRCSVDIHNIELDLRRMLDCSLQEPGILIWDLSRTRYLDISALSYIAAYTARRQKLQMKTEIVLPKTSQNGNRVIDFIRSWQFPEALEAATDTPFEAFLPEDDRAFYAKHVQECPEPRFMGGYVYPEIGRILSDRFFSFRSFRPRYSQSDGTGDTAYAVRESNRWQEDLIRRILSRHMQNANTSTGLVGSAVVFESMLNALRHSNAETIHTASRFAGQNLQPFKPLPTLSNKRNRPQVTESDSRDGSAAHLSLSS